MSDKRNTSTRVNCMGSLRVPWIAAQTIFLVHSSPKYQSVNSFPLLNCVYARSTQSPSPHDNTMYVRATTTMCATVNVLGPHEIREEHLSFRRKYTKYRKQQKRQIEIHRSISSHLRHERTKANVCAITRRLSHTNCQLPIVVVRTDNTARHHRCAVILQMNRTSIRIRYTRWKCVAARTLQASHETRQIE